MTARMDALMSLTGAFAIRLQMGAMAGSVTAVRATGALRAVSLHTRATRARRSHRSRLLRRRQFPRQHRLGRPRLRPLQRPRRCPLRHRLTSRHRHPLRCRLQSLPPFRRPHLPMHRQPSPRMCRQRCPLLCRQPCRPRHRRLIHAMTVRTDATSLAGASATKHKRWKQQISGRRASSTRLRLTKRGYAAASEATTARGAALLRIMSTNARL